MYISEMQVENFRALKRIEMKSPEKLNVIVGPNAVGKSTLLEAIRLSKALLAPRFVDEGQQALISIGALSPHNQAIGGPGIDISALSNDDSKIVRVGFSLTLTPEELAILYAESDQIALLQLQAVTGLQNAAGQLAFTQFLSSPQGRSQYDDISTETQSKISALKKDPKVQMTLIMDSARKTISGGDVFAQSMITLLDRRLPPHRTFFSLFPADRQLPTGEQVLQLGSADAHQNMISYMANPGLKYARLKQVIIQHIMFTEDGRSKIEREFNLILDSLLPGKKLSGININNIGLLRVLVRDEASGKIFDIDQMSSGEKGLLLTFLSVRLSMEEGGIVLLDEPELHLNSLVQSRLLPFIKEHCVEARSLQVIVCTHSPEMVRQAFETEQCNLYHLRSGEDLTPVLSQDVKELYEVFGRLGSSPAEVLFTRGNIYVEGDDDVAIIRAGYGSLIGGFSIKALGGRGDIERDVPQLISEEKQKRLDKPQLFIIDGDRKKANLPTSDLVKVHQHRRYCIENYLLDENILFDILSKYAKQAPESRGSFPRKLKEIALSQISGLAVRSVYNEKGYQSPGIRKADIDGKTVEQSIETLADRLEAIKQSVSSFDRSAWVADMIAEVETKKGKLEAEWESSWKTEASGKTIIDDIYKEYSVSLSKTQFKREIMEKMAADQTEDWRIIEQVLRSELRL